MCVCVCVCVYVFACVRVYVCISPAKALWNLPQTVEGKQEGCVAIATQTTQEVLRGLQTLRGGRVLCHHSNGMKQEVLQVLSQLPCLEEVPKWAFSIVWKESQRGGVRLHVNVCERKCVSVCMLVCEKEGMRVCVCVCVHMRVCV